MENIINTYLNDEYESSISRMGNKIIDILFVKRTATGGMHAMSFTEKDLPYELLEITASAIDFYVKDKK